MASCASSLDDGLLFEDKINGITVYTKSLSETERLKSEVNRLSLLLQQSAQQQDSVQQRGYTGKVLLKELRTLYPMLSACLFTETYRFNADPASKATKVAYVVLSASTPLGESEKKKIFDWLKVRLQNDSLRTVFD